MTTFEVPQEYQEELKGAMSDQSGVKLPFAAPTLYWYNGKTAYKDDEEIKDARRFGGWGIDKEALEEQGLPPSPAWKLHKLSSAKGDSFEAYLFRSAWVAPIARRHAWFENEGKSKSTVNILSYLALRNKEGKFLPYGAVILKASSFTGVTLDKLFKEFATKTAEIRGETLPNFFFHPIGTYGETPKFNTNKGKGGQESSVTDPQLYIPEGGYTAKFLQECFVPNVGSELLADMSNFKKQAKDWLADWNDRKGDKKEAVAPVQTSDDYPESPF
jgi:hypothetical protein